jgi:hypothetical protein
MKRFWMLLLFSVSALRAGEWDINYDGAVLKEEKDGFKVFAKADGTVIRKSDSLEEAVYPDGKKITVRGHLTDVVYADGKKLSIDRIKAEWKYRFPDGRERLVVMSGRTPYGDPILPVERIVQKSPLVSFRYAAERSDDLYDDGDPSSTEEIRDLCEDFLERIRKELLDKKYTEGKSVLIEVEFCRFAEYGYCYNRPKQVIISFLADSKKVSAHSFQWTDLRDQKARAAHAVTIAEMFRGVIGR